MLVLLHTLSNIEITNYFKHKPRFNGVFSRNNLLRVKDGANIINFDDKKKNIKGAHLVSLLLTEIKLYAFILLELNIFVKKY